MSKLRNGLVVLLLVIGLGTSVYVLGSAMPNGNSRNGDGQKGKPPASLLHSWLQISPRPKTPVSSFVGPDGGEMSMADFVGKPVLVNFWATWCEPCKREMPALNRLAASVGRDGPFQVITINEEPNGDASRAWLAENQIDHLPLYQDGKLVMMRDLYVQGYPSGLPVTVLYDAAGTEIARWYSEAEWDSPEMYQKILSLLPTAAN